MEKDYFPLTILRPLMYILYFFFQYIHPSVWIPSQTKLSISFFLPKLAFPFISLLISVYVISIFSDVQPKNIGIIFDSFFLLYSLTNYQQILPAQPSKCTFNPVLPISTLEFFSKSHHYLLLDYWSCTDCISCFPFAVLKSIPFCCLSVCLSFCLSLLLSFFLHKAIIFKSKSSYFFFALALQWLPMPCRIKFKIFTLASKSCMIYILLLWPHLSSLFNLIPLAYLLL